MGRVKRGLEEEMAKFVWLFSYSTDAAAAMIDKPGDRAKAVSKLAEAAGGKLDCFYWMMGPHDGLAIIDVPAAATAAGVSLGIASGGSLKSLESHELLTMQEAATALEHGEEGERGVPVAWHLTASACRTRREAARRHHGTQGRDGRRRAVSGRPERGAYLTAPAVLERSYDPAPHGDQPPHPPPPRPSPHRHRGPPRP